MDGYVWQYRVIDGAGDVVYASGGFERREDAEWDLKTYRMCLQSDGLWESDFLVDWDHVPAAEAVVVEKSW